MAASTYCGADDDEDLFSDTSLPPTLLTEAPSTAIADEGFAVPPMTPTAPVDKATVPMGIPRPNFALPPTTPGASMAPAGRDSWNIPQPITGEESLAPVVGVLMAVPNTAPTDNHAAMPELTDLREHVAGGPSFLSVVFVVIVIAAVVLVVMAR